MSWLWPVPPARLRSPDAGVRDVATPPHLVPLVKDHLSDHTPRGKDSLLSSRPPLTGHHHMAPAIFFKVFYPAREVARIFAGTTSGTPAPALKPRPARRWPNSWAVSVIPLPEPRCATSTLPADRDAEIARRLSQLVETGELH